MTNQVRKIEKDAILRVDTGMTVDQVQKFFTATPKDKIKQRPAKGGGTWNYVEGSYVTQVLNSLFGFMWEFTVLTSMQEALATANTGTVVVQGRLRVKIGDEWVTKEQYGRKDVAYKKGTQTPLDFGNDMKAAATDAKKKCASELGLFADVYSQENFFEAEIVENGISPIEISQAVSQLSTSKELLEYMGSLTIEEKRVASPIVDARIAEINNARS